MTGALLDGIGALWWIIQHVIMLLALLLAFGTWQAARLGLIAWTYHREQEALLFTVGTAMVTPWAVWDLIAAPSVDHAYFAVADFLMVCFFGGAWWKLHTDGPNNGRRRRRAKHALKRLRGRLTPAPAGSPARG